MNERETKLAAMLRSAMCLIHQLRCPNCGQGREMASSCCKDVDCDAGWYGIVADDVKDFLESADQLMPGTLVEIESPSQDCHPQGERSET